MKMSQLFVSQVNWSGSPDWRPGYRQFLTKLQLLNLVQFSDTRKWFIIEVCFTVGSVGVMVQHAGCWTGNHWSWVQLSIVALLHDNSKQVVYTLVPLSPSSIISHRLMVVMICTWEGNYRSGRWQVSLLTGQLTHSKSQLAN